jgi:outer membrane immunogenic protein
VAFFSVSVGLTLLASPSRSAEQTPDSHQWTGFYIGAQLGGAWSDADWRYDNFNWFNTIGPVLVCTKFALDESGVLGGGQAGYTYQTGAFVFGVEGSVAGADLAQSERSPFFPEADLYTTKINLITSITGRVGFACGRWLGYAKGGWSGADIELDLFDHVTPVRANESTWANGWTVGGGAEYAFARSVSLGVEYDYAGLDIDRFTVRCPTCPLNVGGGVPVVDGDIAVQSVTARLNYHFGG